VPHMRAARRSNDAWLLGHISTYVCMVPGQVRWALPTLAADAADGIAESLSMPRAWQVLSSACSCKHIGSGWCAAFSTLTRISNGPAAHCDMHGTHLHISHSHIAACCYPRTESSTDGPHVRAYATSRRI